MTIARIMLCALMLGLPTLGTAGPSPVAADKTKLSDVDIQALAHQHAVNLAEIDLGKLAQKNGTGSVKTYGTTLVKDHRTADIDIVGFAKKQGIATLPSDIAMTAADKKDMSDQVAKLKTLKAADFNREFLNMMVATHEREVTKITADIGLVENKDLGELLKTIKPVLQRHVDTAKTLQKAAVSSTTQP